MKHLIESGLLAILIVIFVILLTRFPIEALKGFLAAIFTLVTHELFKDY